MTSPAFQALASAYLRNAKTEPDAEARAVLALLAAYASRESRGGEAEELLFWGRVCRNAALELPRFERRNAVHILPPERPHQ